MKNKRGTPPGPRPFVLETVRGTKGSAVRRSRYLHLDRAIIAAVRRQLDGAKRSVVYKASTGLQKALVSGHQRSIYVERT